VTIIKHKHIEIKHHTAPDHLEKYSFLWSQARLVIAAIALFIGGTPPIYKFTSFSSSVMYNAVSSLLSICWIISGVAAVYLFYMWNKKGKKLFKKKTQKTRLHFLL